MLPRPNPRGSRGPKKADPFMKADTLLKEFMLACDDNHQYFGEGWRNHVCFCRRAVEDLDEIKKCEDMASDAKALESEGIELPFPDGSSFLDPSVSIHRGASHLGPWSEVLC